MHHAAFIVTEGKPGFLLFLFLMYLPTLLLFLNILTDRL